MVAIRSASDCRKLGMACQKLQKEMKANKAATLSLAEQVKHVCLHCLIGHKGVMKDQLIPFCSTFSRFL